MAGTEADETVRLSLHDYWGLLVRRRWWLMGPLFLCGLAGFMVAHLWPRLYRSKALILVEQQKVTEEYVADVPGRLDTMKQPILSRTSLARLIEQFNLYPRQRSRLVMDDLIGKVRSRIKIEPASAPGRQLTAFTISFEAENPRLAQQVTGELTTMCIEQNMADRTQTSEGTTSFLESQLDDARKDLAQKEQQQREYKLRYLGELPEQEESNLQILSSLETQLRATSDALARAEQEKIYLETVRSEYLVSPQRAPQASDEAPVGTAGAGRVAAADAALRNLRDQLTQLEGKYTPQHPDVIRLRDEIAKWESLKQELENKQANSRTAQAAPSKADAGTPKSQTLIEIDGRLKANAMKIAGYNRDMAHLRQRVGNLQSRLSLTPVREQELAEVTRGYENARNKYQSLLTKKLESELTTHQESGQQGERLRVIDPASLPQKPSEPNQTLVIVIGWSAGLVLGIGLLLLREETMKVLSSEAEVRHSTQLPVLVRIPVLRSPREERRRKWMRAVEITTLTFLVLTSIGTGVYAFLAS